MASNATFCVKKEFIANSYLSEQLLLT